MNAVDDIMKLRPELMDMSVAELQRRMAEMELAIRAKAEKEEAERREKLVAEAASRVERVIDDLRWLHNESFLSAKVTEAFTRSDGQFNPATYLRAPRADDVRAPRRQSEGPVKRRRRRLPDGTLAPSKAAQAVGEV